MQDIPQAEQRDITHRKEIPVVYGMQPHEQRDVKRRRYDPQRPVDRLLVAVLRKDVRKAGVLGAGHGHDLARTVRARRGKAQKHHRQQRGGLVDLGKARRLGQQKCHQPHRPERADVRVLEDGEPLVAVAEGTERVAGVAQAVQMDAARDKQRDERRAHRVKQRRRAEMRAEQVPQPLCRAHQRAHERQEGQRPAHGPFLPLHLRHGHCRVERKRDQQAAPRAFHGVSSSFTGSKMPHTDS